MMTGLTYLFENADVRAHRPKLSRMSHAPVPSLPLSFSTASSLAVALYGQMRMSLCAHDCVCDLIAFESLQSTVPISNCIRIAAFFDDLSHFRSANCLSVKVALFWEHLDRILLCHLLFQYQYPLIVLRTMQAASLVVMSGVLLAYDFYDTAHFLLHHGGRRMRLIPRRLKTAHMSHHYSNHDASFGISSSLFDVIFNSCSKSVM